MLRIYFGERPNSIYNTSLYFKNRYEDNWIMDSFAKEIIKDVYKSEVIDEHTIDSPVLWIISPVQLSGGVKALLLMKPFPGKIFNATNCGDNCAKCILKLAENKDFEIRVLNDKKLVVHNMLEFLDAGIKYLQEDAK